MTILFICAIYRRAGINCGATGFEKQNAIIRSTADLTAFSNGKLNQQPQRPRLIVQLVCLFQREGGIGAKRDAITLVTPRVAKVPRLGTVDGNVKKQTVEIGQCIGFIGSFSFALPKRSESTRPTP